LFIIVCPFVLFDYYCSVRFTTSDYTPPSLVSSNCSYCQTNGVAMFVGCPEVKMFAELNCPLPGFHKIYTLVLHSKSLLIPLTREIISVLKYGLRLSMAYCSEC
jgi:hypothetical protein